MRTATFVILATAGLIAACTPARMGESQAALTKLLERQRACDDMQRLGRSLTDEQVVECSDVRNALGKMGEELAREARKPETSSANAIFFLRRAATAAWRSQDREAMRNASDYARAGSERCPAPGATGANLPADCALLRFLPALIGHDEGMILYRLLEADARRATSALAKRGVLLAADELDRKEKRPKFAVSNSHAFEGWRMLLKAWNASCSTSVDESVRVYAKDVDEKMRKNLRSAADTSANAAGGSPLESSRYTDHCTSQAENNVIAKDAVALDSFQKMNRLAWCRAEFAENSPKPECTPR